MAIVWMDGFDVYAAAGDLGAFSYSNSGFGVATTGGAFGGGAAQSDGNSARYLLRTDTFALEVWTSFRYKCDFNSASNQSLIQILSSAGVECTILLNTATGEVRAYRGAGNGTLLGTSTITNWGTARWFWFDIHYAYNNSAGVVEVWVNDTQVLNLTAQNTANNSGQTSLDGIALNGGVISTGNGVSGYFDDWIINDTTGSHNTGRIGDARIETLVPTSDATPNQATPSTGTNHWAVVDEPQYNTTDYLTMASTSGHKEVFGHGALVSTPASVNAVAVKLVSQKSDAGAFNLQPLVIASGSEADGASQALPLSWGVQTGIFEVNPNTSAAWAYAAVNSASIGYKVP